jgi:polyhydroxyalkanoate synthase
MKWFQRAKNLTTLVQRNKPTVGATPADVVHAENKWRLLRYRPRPEGLAYTTPVLMVPSLINRHYVLDLMPGKSLAEDLVARGHDLYVIDWGTPGPEDRFLSFDDVCDRYLGRAIRVAAQHSETAAVHLLGYCLGGTLAVSVQLALKICRALLDLLAAGSLGPRLADRIGTLDLDGGELVAKIVRLLL